MTDTTPAGPPSLAEITALTARLRTLSNAGADCGPGRADPVPGRQRRIDGPDQRGVQPGRAPPTPAWPR